MNIERPMRQAESGHTITPEERASALVVRWSKGTVKFKEGIVADIAAVIRHAVEEDRRALR